MKIAVIGSGCSVATEATADISHYYNITHVSKYSLLAEQYKTCLQSANSWLQVFSCLYAYPSLHTDLLCVLLHRAGIQGQVSLLLPIGTNWSIHCTCLFWCHPTVWVEENWAYCAEREPLYSGMSRSESYKLNRLEFSRTTYVHHFSTAQYALHSSSNAHFHSLHYNVATTAENNSVGTESLVTSHSSRNV